MKKLTEQQVDILLKHVLRLQEQPSLSVDPIRDKREADRRAKERQEIEDREMKNAKWGPRVKGLDATRPAPIPPDNTSRGKYLARIIYDAKGIVTDSENNATRAILAIQDKKTFADTQRELQKLTGGRGIGQYINSFFGTYTERYIAQLRAAIVAKQTVGYTAGQGVRMAIETLSNRKHWKTQRRLSKIIKHLQTIGAYSSTISELQKTYDKIKEISDLEIKIWKSSISKQTQDFWNKYYHEILLTLEIITSLIAFPIGLMISAGIGFVNAGLYANEGDYYQAGVSAVFSLMPGIFHLASKIPAIAKLGAKGMGKLGEKMLQRSGKLTKLELAAANGLIKSRNLLKDIYLQWMKDAAARAEMDILTKAGFKSMLPRVLQGKPNPELLAKVANLSAADKIVLMISKKIISVAELGVILTGVSKMTDMIIHYGWDPIYERYFERSEYENALVKELTK